MVLRLYQTHAPTTKMNPHDENQSHGVANSLQINPTVNEMVKTPPTESKNDEADCKNDEDSVNTLQKC